MSNAVNELDPAEAFAGPESGSTWWRFTIRVTWIAIQLIAVYFMCGRSEPLF